jgi:UDP-N-acetylmuramoyl-tripeptide--D-alanyl-D-alanine ligase
MKPKVIKIIQYMLQSLARAIIKRYRPGIIGITGNVGKTSTKEAIYTVLSRDRRVRASKKNFNNELGLPLTILGNWKDTGGILFYLNAILSGIIQLIIKRASYPEILILEYGVNKPGDMKRLLEITRPMIGVVTAIGETPVHVEFFAGKEGIVREKTRLIASLPTTGFAIINADDKSVREMRGKTRAHAITYGFTKGADVHIMSHETRLRGGAPETTFKVTYGGSTIPVRLEHALGKAHIYAAAAAAATGLAFGMNLVKVGEALAGYKPPPGRMRIIPGVKQSVIIDDTYNASPLASKDALETLKGIKTKRKIAVLGDMLELGKHTIEAHQEIGTEAASAVKALFTVGQKAKFIAEAAEAAGLPKRSIFVFNNVREAGRELQKMLEPGDVVLVKASQSVRLEKIVKEVMAEPEKADQLLARQSPRWLDIPGIYDN